MNAREELAREVFIADNSGQSREDSLKDWAAYNMAISHTYAHNIADGLMAVGYTKPRTITTAEELDALPVASVVISLFTDGHGHVMQLAYQKWEGVGWHRGGRQSGTHPDYILPATVLWEPAS